MAGSKFGQTPPQIVTNRQISNKMANREQKRSVETKRALLDAALVEFAASGFEGASLRQIGAAAGVNHRLIQHHFGCKMTLWTVSARKAYSDFEDRLNRRLEGLEGVSEKEKITLLFREFILHCAENPALHKFMLQANQEPERMQWVVDNLLRNSQSLVHSFN